MRWAGVDTFPTYRKDGSAPVIFGPMKKIPKVAMLMTTTTRKAPMSRRMM